MKWMVTPKVTAPSISTTISITDRERLAIAETSDSKLLKNDKLVINSSSHFWVRDYTAR
jgi:hypothetical protein